MDNSRAVKLQSMCQLAFWKLSHWQNEYERLLDEYEKELGYLPKELKKYDKYGNLVRMDIKFTAQE